MQNSTRRSTSRSATSSARACSTLSIAGYFDRQKLKLLANLFFKQSEEEREHALKFVHYVLNTKGDLRIPAIPAPTPSFSTAEEAVAAALKWEEEVTAQIKP